MKMGFTGPLVEFSTLVDILSWRARISPISKPISICQTERMKKNI